MADDREALKLDDPPKTTKRKGIKVSTIAKTDGMKYEIAGTKRVKDGKRVAVKMAEQLGTGSLIWLLVKRHKVGLLAVGNIVLVLNWAFPLWPQMVLGIVGK